MEKLNLKVNGTSYEVEVGDLSVNPVEVVVNGVTYHVELESASGVARPVAAPVRVSAPVSAPLPVITPAPVVVASAPSGNGDASAIRAPMPGTIRDILVKPGDTVTAGQQVFELEAMKMKSALRSPREGVVASVEVTEGQKVAHGQVLLRFA